MFEEVPDGTFLIRESVKRAGEYSLSLQVMLSVVYAAGEVPVVREARFGLHEYIGKQSSRSYAFRLGYSN